MEHNPQVRCRFWYSIVPGLLLVLLLLAACAPDNVLPNSGSEPPEPAPTRTATASEADTPGPSPTVPDDVLTPFPELIATPLPVSTSTPRPTATATHHPDEIPDRSAPGEFSTDFSIHSIPYAEIRHGGPRKDGIRSIDSPKYISIEEAEEWLDSFEPVIAVKVGEQARAFPIQILIWHEITNAEVGGEPLVVTFCPLCNTGIVFKRTVGGEVLDFGTTGRLRFSNLLMYDRQSESWWQQATGEALVGTMTGMRLEFVPAEMISWAAFREHYPDGEVLSNDTGIYKNYGYNPYEGYDDVRNPPMLYKGPPTPRKLSALERVLTIDSEIEPVAYPYRILEEVRVVNDEVDGKPIVVFWANETASALDDEVIALGRDVGSANAYSRVLDGEALTFQWDGKVIADRETGSVWNALGAAVSGPLAGIHLTPVVSINHFWFSWAAFKPATRIYAVE